MVLRQCGERIIDERTAVDDLQMGQVMRESTCTRCLRVISPEETIQFTGRGMFHVNCRIPRDLSPEERALLFRFCRDHAVAKCTACAQSFRQTELGADLLGNRAYLCPRCRVDLTESVRGHLYSCAMLPENVHLRAREARDATAKLIRQNYQAADGADVLLREAEAAIAALRDTMRQLPSAR